MYEKRFYRKAIHSAFKLEVAHQESDLLICSDAKLEQEKVYQHIHKYYKIIEVYCQAHPEFKTALSPYAKDSQATQIIQDMIAFSTLAEVGPFAAVAGAVAEYVGRELLGQCDEVIVENGGDIFLKINQDKIIAVYPGEASGMQELLLRIAAREEPFGVASSSAVIGHSLNFGKADVVSVVADNALLADSFATGLSNKIHSDKEAQAVIEQVKIEPSLQAVVIVFDKKLYLWGDIELV